MSKIAFAAVIVLVAAQSQAGLFGSSKKQANAVTMPPQDGKTAATDATSTNAGPQLMRRAHIHFDDAETEQAFLQLTAARRRAQEDLQVVTRLVQEKKVELAKFTSDLNTEFAIEPDGNYQYDETDQTVYELVRKPAAEGDTNAAPDLVKDFDKKEHVKLDDAAKKERFLRLVAAKKLSNEEIQVLGLLQSEKDIEFTNVQQQLVSRYAISSDREYRYDKTTRTVYEIVPVPKGGEVIKSQAEESVPQ